VPDAPGIHTYVVVKQVRPGLRMRLGFRAPELHRPENFSDDACAHFFDGAQAKAPPEFVEALTALTEEGL
jgi:hypothetical protein